MKRITTTNIVDPNIQQPFTGKSLDFLQDANKETFIAVAIGFIGARYDVLVPYILNGLVPFGTNKYTEGYVLFNGEIYYSPGKSTTTAFSNIAVLTITSTSDAVADPVVFTDNIPRDVHYARTLVLSDDVSGAGDFDLANAEYINKFIVASTPTFTAYDTSDVVVAGGVTVTTPVVTYRRTSTGLRFNFSAAAIATLANTAKIQMTLPISLPITPASSQAVGTGVCRYFKAGTGGISTFVWIALNSSGSGTGLTIEKYDGTAFGVTTGYLVNFSIDIDII